jgi:hypothetical protein
MVRGLAVAAAHSPNPPYSVFIAVRQDLRNHSHYQKKTIIATIKDHTIMPPHDTPGAFSDTETKLLNSLASRFSIDADEQAHLAEACRLLEAERVPGMNPVTASVQVGVAQVSTLVCTGKSSFPGSSYIVPPFAVHWGVIVGCVLFHLRYNSKLKTVKFCLQLWDETQDGSRHEVDVVGTTKYYTEELIIIGIHWYEITDDREKVDCCVWRLS